MKWKKLGRIFCADNQNDFMISGGRAPVSLHIEDDLFKIFFASYDKEGIGRIFSLLINQYNCIIIIDKKPSLKLILTLL